MDVGRHIAKPACSTAENCIDNENIEETENITEPEYVADKVGSENTNIAEECMMNAEVISLKRRTSDIQNSAQDGPMINAKRRKQEQNETLYKYDEIIEKVGETANAAPKEESENAVTNNEGRCTQHQHFSAAVDVLVQVTRGIDKCTSTHEVNILLRREVPLFLATRNKMPSRASFSYDSLISNTWQEVSVKRSTTAQASSIFQKSTIDVYPAESYLNEGSILGKFQFLLAGKELFYHGATIDSVKSIIEEGINVTESNRPVDFSCGKGFYVTNNYDKALQWSKQKAKRCKTTGAVIAFKIDRIRNERHLSLDVNSYSNRKFWECIVSHFRHSQTSPDVTRVLRDVKYIEGPVARGIRRIGNGELPTPADSGQFRQLCICDQGYANTFGHLDNILCVIWVKYR